MRVVTDGGARVNGYGHERNDCCVVAIAMVLGKTYKQAHHMLEYAGYDEEKGFDIIDFLKHFEFKGYRTTKIDTKVRQTAEKWQESLSSGAYILYTHHHVVSIVDGILFDTVQKPSRANVKHIWKFEKIA